MKKLFYILPLLFWVAACGSGISEKDARIVATNAALGTPPPAEYQTAAAIYLNLTLTPTRQPAPAAAAAPTLSPYEFSLTQVAYQQQLDREREEKKQYALMTQQANEQTLRMEQLRVEQAAINATNDANSIRATETADFKTAVAYQDLLTSQAAATATAKAIETQAQNTQIARSATEAVAPIHATWTEAAIHVVQTVEAGTANDVELAVKRTSATNMLIAYGPWALIIGLSYVGARGFQTFVKTRTHTRDEHGRQQTIQRETADGGVIFVRPEQMETGIIKVTGSGEVLRYEAMDKQEQSDINRRSQIVDAIAALPMPYAKNAQTMMKSGFGDGGGNPSVQIVNDARALSPVLDEAESKLLEE